MSGFGVIGSNIGNTQQRLNGDIILSGGIAVQQSKRLVIALLGDSKIQAADFREEAWKAFRKTRGLIKFQGVQGLIALTGGTPGRRQIGDWRHNGFSGRRFTRADIVSANPSTNVFTLNSHPLATGVPCVLTSIAGTLTGLSTNTLYWPVTVNANTFQLATTPGGTAVDFGGSTGNVTIGTGLIELWPGIAAAWDEAPDVVFIDCGTNDFFAGSSASTVLSSASTLIDLIRSSYPNTEIIITSPVPIVPGSSSGVNQATLNATRTTYVAGLPALVATKDKKVGYYDTANGLNDSDFQSDGVHPLRKGNAKVARNYADALSNLFPVVAGSAGLAVPRTPRTRPAQASMVLDSDTDNLTFGYNVLLSPADQSFAFGLWYYPTALPTDSAVHPIVKYANAHPNGFLLGHFASSGNGGGLIFYLTSGTPLFSGSISSAYAYENLKINKWHRIVVVCDRNKLLCGCFINGQLIQWVPISSTWNITQNENTIFGRFSSFNAALGYYDRYFIAKGSTITVDNALEYVEKDYYEGIEFPGTTCTIDMSEGTGTSVASQTFGVSAGTLSGGTWIAALNTPKPGIDEAADGTGNAAV